jgi:hypothetical protein
MAGFPDFPDPKKVRELFTDMLGQVWGGRAYRGTLFILVPLIVATIAVVCAREIGLSADEFAFANPWLQQLDGKLSLQSSHAPPTTLGSEPKLIKSRSVAELMKPCEEQTAACDPFLKDVQGERISIEGTIVYFDSTIYVFHVGPGTHNVQCVFDAKWKAMLSKLGHGSAVQFTGNIEQIVDDTLILNYCAIDQ